MLLGIVILLAGTMIISLLIRLWFIKKNDNYLYGITYKDSRRRQPWRYGDEAPREYSE